MILHVFRAVLELELSKPAMSNVGFCVPCAAAWNGDGQEKIRRRKSKCDEHVVDCQTIAPSFLAESLLYARKGVLQHSKALHNTHGS